MRDSLLAILLPSAVAVGVAVPAATGVASTTRGAAVPAGLVGTWTRTVTAEDARRVGGQKATSVFPGAVWTLSVKRTGAATYTQGYVTIMGQVVVTGPGHVRIKDDSTPDTYAWHRSGSHLTFTKLKDPERDRIVTFSGIWKRK
jgi:hypothetical protein